MHLNYRIQQNGFSLLEALVAVAIMSLAITGTLSVISNNVTAAANAKDRVTAFYLAQDALEYVRNLRDTGAIVRGKGRAQACGSPNPPGFCGNPDGALGSEDWLGPLRDCVDATCLVDTTEELDDDAVEECGNETIAEAGDEPVCDGSNDRIRLDDDGFYRHDFGDNTGGDPTHFFREVSVEQSGDTSLDQEAIITVRMRWQPRGVEHTFTISEHLFNWQSELGPRSGEGVDFTPGG